MCVPSSQAPWPNGQGVWLLIRRMRVRIPSGSQVSYESSTSLLHEIKNHMCVSMTYSFETAGVPDLLTPFVLSEWWVRIRLSPLFHHSTTSTSRYVNNHFKGILLYTTVTVPISDFLNKLLNKYDAIPVVESEISLDHHIRARIMFNRWLARENTFVVRILS